jgi:aminopeptidase N
VHDSKPSARKAFARTPAIIEFLSRTFGPYPFESCGNVLTNLPVPGALETQTKPIYGRGTGVEEIICHELAHQWFGDAVCVEDWNDIWINEGFAEYAAWMYVESTNGAEKFEKKLQQNYSMARTMQAGPPGTPGVTSMFGVESYVRGPLVLHAIRQELGDERFVALMRKWVADHLHGNASVEDFVELVGSLGDARASEALQHWLYDEEMPSVAAWDEVMARQKAESDARRKARDEERERKKAENEKAEAEKTRDG